MDDKVIYEAECPGCGEFIEFYNIGWKICPHCKEWRAEFTVTFEQIHSEDKEDE